MACMQHGARGRRAIGRASLSAALLSVAACAGRIDAARDPFALGVASGYPSPDGFVIWTRLAPCLLYTSPSPRDRQKSRMPSSA